MASRRKEPRCSYKEGNRRCPFPGAGDPPLCQPHQLAVAELARPKSSTEVILTSLMDFVNGKRVDPAVFGSAVDDWIKQWGPRRQAQTGAGWYPGHEPRRRPPYPPQDERAQMRAAARRVLGFQAGDRLTVEAVKERKRALAKRHHPDRGGSVQAMAAINDAADVLLEELAER